jgi:hypothetical protein
MQNLQRVVRGLAFYAIAAFGGLLSIISIVVVLELRGPASVPPELAPAKLHESLTARHALARERYAEPLPTADSAELAAAAADTSARSRTLLSLYRTHEALTRQWRARQTALVAENGEAAAATALIYEVEAGRPGAREREVRFLELRRWHLAQSQRADAHLDSGRAALAGAHVALAGLREARTPASVSAWEREARTELRTVQRLLAHSPSFLPPAPRREVRLADSWWSWHPFSALSGWLRTQRSLELASVIGMLGFGLLGAAASTVVRQRRTDARDGTHLGQAVLGNHLTNLVLSGVSAALATYLALKGGLAVISAEGAEPNPYVLLLTCFVAAVYWEEAWERVRGAVRRSPDDAPEPHAADRPQDPPADADQAQERAKIQLPAGEIVTDAGTAATSAPGASR